MNAAPQFTRDRLQDYRGNPLVARFQQLSVMATAVWVQKLDLGHVLSKQSQLAREHLEIGYRMMWIKVQCQFFIVSGEVNTELSLQK